LIVGKTRAVRIARRIKKIPTRLINRLRCDTSVGGESQKAGHPRSLSRSHSSAPGTFTTSAHSDEWKIANALIVARPLLVAEFFNSIDPKPTLGSNQERQAASKKIGRRTTKVFRRSRTFLLNAASAKLSALIA
jgi:hypothetical protein